jgi:hypothetical protein
LIAVEGVVARSRAIKGAAAGDVELFMRMIIGKPSGWLEDIPDEWRRGANYRRRRSM